MVDLVEGTEVRVGGVEFFKELPAKIPSLLWRPGLTADIAEAEAIERAEAVRRFADLPEIHDYLGGLQELAHAQRGERVPSALLLPTLPNFVRDGHFPDMNVFELSGRSTSGHSYHRLEVSTPGVALRDYYGDQPMVWVAGDIRLHHTLGLGYSIGLFAPIARINLLEQDLIIPHTDVISGAVNFLKSLRSVPAHFLASIPTFRHVPS